MPSWSDLQNYIRNNRFMLSDDELAMALGWQYLEEDGSVGRQTLFIYRMPAYDEDWLVMASDICPEEALLPRDALLVNSELTLGSLALREGVYGLRYTFSIATLALTDIVLWMERVVWAAVEVRQRLRAGTLLQGQVASLDHARVHGHWVE